MKKRTAQTPASAGVFLRRHICAGLLFLIVLSASAGTSLHTTYLWHLHQPVYWPDRRVYGGDHYEAAWDTIQQQNAGRGHPTPEVLNTIFSVDDRVNAYQWRVKDALSTISGYGKSGAQLSYSGALMENIQSLGAAGQLGYSGTWNSHISTARTWTTSNGKPRLDTLNFTYHHSLAPFVSDETLEMELRIHRRQMELIWGSNPLSRGYFPAETCFSERMIPVLKKVGIDWAIVGNNHLSRSCVDFPLVIGSGGENCDIPNKADQLNPAQGSGNYQRVTIERGMSPAAAMPFAYQLHYARYLDPQTGVENKLIVVPSDQALGWKDSYGTWDLNLLNNLNARNDPSKPALVLLAHDGDNAWSGGYSYYMEWVNNFVSQASGRGYEASTVEQFLYDHPVDPSDVVHVEDGGWVDADGDFGSPIYINWHWPPSYSSGGVNVVDPSTGVSDKADNWRTIVATENCVKTAQQLSGVTPRVDQVRDPGSFSTTPNAVELGWHYYLGGLDSGFVYYGCSGDMCKRTTIVQSNALRNVSSILSNLSNDTTPPTIFLPQRHPWNPGSTNYGVQYSYRLTTPANSDFWVWTYVFDISGVTNVTLHFRNNGSYAPSGNQFQTYAGGPNTGSWNLSGMTKRVAAPVTGANPQYIADYYHAKVTGITDAYVDYYVSATDAHGNTYNSPIQHVYVGTSSGTSSAPTSPTNVAATPVATNQINVSWNAVSGASGYIIKRGAVAVGQTNASPFADKSLLPNTQYCYTVVATNSTGASADSVSVCATTPATNAVIYPSFVMDAVADSPGFLLSSPGMTIYAAIRGTKLYVATWSPGTSGGANDHFIFVSDELLSSALSNAPWAKTGKIAVANTKPFLGGESAGSFVGWFNAPASSLAIKAPTNAGQMEGIIDLVEAFGSMPTNIYLASAAYATADGGALAAQAPEGTGPDLDPNEFFVIPTIALRDNNGDGVFDRLDPLMDFSLRKILFTSDGYSITWNSMPRRSYQLMYRDLLTAAWIAVPSWITNAGPLDTVLSLMDTNNTPQRYYQVKLLP